MSRSRKRFCRGGGGGVIYLCLPGGPRPVLGRLFLLVKCKLFKKFEFSRRSGWVPDSPGPL